MDKKEKGDRLRTFLTLFSFWLLLFGGLLFLSEQLPITWDEGDSYARADKILLWARGDRYLSSIPSFSAFPVVSACLSSSASLPFSMSETKWTLMPNRLPRTFAFYSEVESLGDSVSQRATFLKRADFSKAASSRQSRFSEGAIAACWPHTIVREGHPAGYSIVIAVGKWLASPFQKRPGNFWGGLSEKSTYRFGPLLLFSLTLIAVFRKVSQIFDRKTGVFCVLAILCLPRLLAHSLIAACDSPLISCWLLTWLTFLTFRERRTFRSACLFGGAMGLTFSMKLTGWLVPVPCLLFAIFSLLRRRFFFTLKTNAGTGTVAAFKKIVGGETSVGREANASFATETASAFRSGICEIGLWGVGGGIAILTFFGLNPPLWHHPLQGFETFFYLNCHRDAFNIPVWFLGNFYDLQHPLPWFNTIVWTGVTVPAGLLLLAIFSVGRSLRTGMRQEGSVSIAPRSTKKSEETRAVFKQTWLGFGRPRQSSRRRQLGSWPLRRGSKWTQLGSWRLKFGSIWMQRGSRRTMFGAWRLKEILRRREGDGVKPIENERQTVSPRDGILSVFLFFVTLIVVRAFPGVPVHDGVRLFVPAFAFWGILAGIGAGRLWNRFDSNPIGFYGTKTLVLAIFACSFFNIVNYCPHWLSFYNRLINGPVGAKRAGFEPTYYWDALDREICDWLNRHSSENDLLLFGSFSSQTLQRYQTGGDLKCAAQTVSAIPGVFSERLKRSNEKKSYCDSNPEPERLKDTKARPGVLTDSTGMNSSSPHDFRWYVLQRRPSGLTKFDLRVIRDLTPVYVKKIDAFDWRTQKIQYVPLIEIYEMREIDRYLHELAARSLPPTSNVPKEDAPQTRDKKR